MAEINIADALDTIRSLSRQFSAFARLEAIVEGLVVAIGQRDDLTAHIAKLRAERDALAASVAAAKEARAASAKALDEAKAAQDAAEEKRAQAAAERDGVLASLESEKARITTARNAAFDELRKAQGALADTRAAHAADLDARKAALADLDATKSATARQIAALEAHRDELKSKLSSLLA